MSCHKWSLRSLPGQCRIIYSHGAFSTSVLIRLKLLSDLRSREQDHCHLIATISNVYGKAGIPQKYKGCSSQCISLPIQYLSFDVLLYSPPLSFSIPLPLSFLYDQGLNPARALCMVDKYSTAHLYSQIHYNKCTISSKLEIYQAIIKDWPSYILMLIDKLDSDI